MRRPAVAGDVLAENLAANRHMIFMNMLDDDGVGELQGLQESIDVVAVHQIVEACLADNDGLGCPADDAGERVDEVFEGSAPSAVQIDAPEEDGCPAGLQYADWPWSLGPAFEHQCDLMPLVEGFVRHPGPELFATTPRIMKHRGDDADPHRVIPPVTGTVTDRVFDIRCATISWKSDS